MRIGNLIVAASAASLVHAYPTRDIKKRGSGFTWVGVSESGAEFGSSIPGTLGTDYTWPDTSKIQILRDDGMNVFRIPFLMERLAPNQMTGSLDATYLKDLKSTVQAVTDSGAYAVLDPHNYGRYSGSIISSTSDFETFWKTVAGEFASNEKVIFDTNNEYHDMEQSLVLSLNQAAIDGIRAAGATTQYIFVEGNSYSGAWKWADTNDNLSQLTDPQDKIVYEMHQYLDSDGSGTSETCASSTIGEERLQTATQWLKTNNKKGFLGEFAGGVNEQCEQAVEGLLSYMSDNSDVWMGAEWWSAGPWWGSYMYSMEPTDGTAYSTYLPILKKYFVDGTGASTSSSTTSAAPSTAAASTSTSASASTASASSTTISAVESSSTSSVAEAPSTTSEVVTATPTPSHPAPQPTSNSSSVSSDAPTSSTPTTLATSPACGYHTTVTVTASRSTAAPSSSASAVAHYYQCGGINYSGPTTCESSYTCVKQNPYYSQCL